MNEAGDYSSAYCILHTSDASIIGTGMTFTIGRGNDLVCHAIRLLAKPLIGRTLESLTKNMGATWRLLVSDSQLRWVGPEKGVTQLALGAIVNALWDLWARSVDKSVWRLVADMAPEEVARCIDFRYLEDELDYESAVKLLYECRKGKEERIKTAEANRAVQAYTTSAGWLGYSDEKMRTLLAQSLKDGYKHFKLKVGGTIEQDSARLYLAREVLGYDKGNILMVDANQVWSVPGAISHMQALSKFKPLFIEEPTSPDDILGHAAIRRALAPLGIKVATGEMCHNRVMFKQLLQAGAIDYLQADACRLGGLNEVLSVLLLAKKFAVPVVPHSGGVGLPEYTQHVSTIDYILFGGETRLLEYVEHLHEHFEEPCRVEGGWFVTPGKPGYSVRMKEESMRKFEFPGEEGGFWRSEAGRKIVEGM